MKTSNEMKMSNEMKTSEERLCRDERDRHASDNERLRTSV
jgi:hypothetical protein